MDNETREFLSDKIPFRCPRCNQFVLVGLSDVGRTVLCPNCSLEIRLEKEVVLDNADDLSQDVEEFLQKR